MFENFCVGIHVYSAFTYEVMKSYLTRVLDKKIRNSYIKASVTPEPNKLRIHPNFRIRRDSGTFCSPSPNGRKIVRDSETFVEGFGLFLNIQNEPNTLKNGPEYGPDKFHSGHIRDGFGRIRGGVLGILGRFELIRIVRGGTTRII